MPRERATVAMAAMLQWFGELADQGLFTTDAELRILSWNRWLEARTGRTEAEVVGAPLLDLYPDLVARGLDQYYRDALGGEVRVISQRLHGYVLPMPGELTADIGQVMMAQAGRLAPLAHDGHIVGTITLIQDVSRRVATERQLREQIAALELAKSTAEAALRVKDEFLATLSHEIRTPLNAVLGWARLLRGRETETQTVRRALDVIERNASVQARLIEDMLDMARIATGKLRLEMQPVDVVAIVLGTIDVVGPGAAAKGVTIRTVFDEDLAAIDGDPDRLQQVVWNLLSNAVKFTPRGGSVEVRVSRSGDTVELSVTDTGQGIHAEFLPHVFDRFRQADGSASRRHGGLGLGLALVRQLVELHGGRVEVFSDGSDRGSRFVVRLPARPVTSAAADTRAQSSATPDLSGTVVLAVDDEADALEIVAMALRQFGATVLVAHSVEDALATVAQQPRLDVVVCDIAMPAHDGYEFVKLLRAGHGGRKLLPAIALTAYSSASERQHALQAGYQLHVAKPIEPIALARAVANLARTDPGRASA